MHSGSLSARTRTNRTIRQILSRGFVILTLILISAGAQAQFSLQFLGQELFPTGTPIVGGTTVGGLSAITYDRAANRYYILSDDRSQVNAARFYTATIDLSGNILTSGRVNFTGVTTLLQPNS